MQIKDRNTEFPNRRRLEVEEIEYNENGEIEVLLVEVKRDEGEVYEEGTQINATNLDLIIRSKVTEILSMSDEERVEYDASKIELEVDVEAITQDFSLPTKGINGSSIVWSVEGEGIEIEENIAKVNRKLYEQNPLLKARVSYGSAETIQVFHVTVLLREMTPSERVEQDSNDLKIDTKVTTDFTLPSAGSNGSSITWVVKTGTSITITGNTANVHNGEIDAYSTLEATITYESVTTTKNFVVEVISISFLPKTYAVSWTQEKGSLKTDELTIASSNGEKLYIEVENNYSSAIEVSIKANDSSLVKVEVKETTDLNAMMGTSYVEYTFTVHIYLSSDREIKLGSLNGSVKYYYASITPDD